MCGGDFCDMSTELATLWLPVEQQQHNSLWWGLALLLVEADCMQSAYRMFYMSYLRMF